MKNKKLRDMRLDIANKRRIRSFISLLFLFCILFPLPSPLSPILYAADFTYIQPGIRANSMGGAFSAIADDPYAIFYRSEERRVGKECRSRWSPYH